MKHRDWATNPASPRPRRSGIVIIAAIVCLGVASMIVLALLRTTLVERDAVRTEVWRIQAAWLAESGLERAAARLAAEPGYQGETWKIPAELLGGDKGGVVRIEVRPVAQQPDRRLVRVQADFPDHPQHRARRSKEVIVQLEPSS